MIRLCLSWRGGQSPERLFVTNASTLLASTILAQAITFGLSFVMTRLYTPAEFGHFAIFAGTAGVLAAAATGAMDRVIVLARSDAEARRAGTVTLILSLTCGISVSLIGLIAAALGLTASLPLSVLELVLYIPVFMVAYAGAQILNATGLRYNKISLMASFKVVQSALTGAVQVVASSLGSVPGLVIGSLAGWLLMLGGGLSLHLRRHLTWRETTPRALFSVIRRNWRYPFYVMPNELLDNISNQAPIFLLASFMSLSVAGHYGLAITMLSAPAAILGRTVGQVFLQYIGSHRGEPLALRRTMTLVWAGMAAIGIVPFGTMVLLAPQIFQFSFGVSWFEAGVVAQTLSVLLFVRFVSSPTSSIYLKLNMQREQAWFTMAAAGYRPACYALATTGLDLNIILLLHVVIETTAIVVYNLVALRRLEADGKAKSGAIE